MAGQILDSQLGSDGIILCRAILARDGVANWKAAIDSRYHEIEIAHRNGHVAKINSIVGTRERFVPTASSFTIGALNSERLLTELLNSISTEVAGMWIRNFLGSRLLCNLDESWVRRQYAPSRYPPLHAPHGWHQDGALKFVFSRTSMAIFRPSSKSPRRQSCASKQWI
jgi:hypothetical protein